MRKKALFVRRLGCPFPVGPTVGKELNPFLMDFLYVFVSGPTPFVQFSLHLTVSFVSSQAPGGGRGGGGEF